MKYQSQFLSDFAERGYLYQCTAEAELDALAKSKPITAYIGFDATADSLHVGSLIQIMILRLLQKCGHKPIVLMGGGTSLVGDPSGKDESRKMLTEKDIASNIEKIQKVFAQFLTFGSGKTDAVIVNNADWLKGLNYIDFLRDVGKHFSVNRMIGFESVKLRLDREQPLSFLEFNYMVLQAYDFMELKRQHGCDLQIGGADQWGNIVCGIDLARRIDSESLYGLTTPLLTTSSGAKMGKTADGAVWLNKDKLPVYDYWQFWRNTEDADVGRFLRLFTELPMAEIAKLESLQGSEINEAKIILATEITALCHGKDEAEKAKQTASNVFGEIGISKDLPTITIPRSDFEKDFLQQVPNYPNPVDLSLSLGLLEVLKKIGFTSSNSEGRRFIEQGAVKINDKAITDPSYKLRGEDITSFVGFEKDESQELVGDELMKTPYIKISLGKKKHGYIVVQEGA